MEAGTLTVYRECIPVVDAEYDIEGDESPVEAIVQAVNIAGGEETPLDSSPLYEYVNPDAINNLFEHAGSMNTALQLSFCIDNWNVFVRADGKIRVCDATQPTSPEPVFSGFPG